MHWQDANEFFSMGGRGGFVWGAYGTMAALMLVEPLLARWRLRAARRAIVDRLDDEAAATAGTAGGRR
jgi:heme exporter protein CcmD